MGVGVECKVRKRECLASHLPKSEKMLQGLAWSSRVGIVVVHPLRKAEIRARDPPFSPQTAGRRLSIVPSYTYLLLSAPLGSTLHSFSASSAPPGNPNLEFVTGVPTIRDILPSSCR